MSLESKGMEVLLACIAIAIRHVVARRCPATIAAGMMFLGLAGF